MKKLFGITFGGLQHKILNLVLILILVQIAFFAGVTVYNSYHLSKVVGSARTEQQEAIAQVSGDTMKQVVDGSMTMTNSLQADTANQKFAEVEDNIKVLRALAQSLFEQRDTLEPAPFAPPDPEKDGILSAHVLFEEGVDYTQSELLPIAAHMSETLMAMWSHNDVVGGCYIGLSDGTHIGVGTSKKDKFDENGVQKPFPVRERPWYVGAVEKGDIFFTGIERDAFNDTVGITCSAPVIVDGELFGVVGIDFVLGDVEESVQNSDSGSGFFCIVNNEGQIVFAPDNNGLFEVETADKAVDLRESDNSVLATLVTEALVGQTPVKTVEIDGKEYYMTGSPMKTVGWAVISVVQKSAIDEPTKLMLEEYDRINENSTASYRDGMDYSRMITIGMIGVVLIFGILGAMAVANKIVRPVEQMTDRMTSIIGTDQVFEMEDAYRTGDEVEVLAQSLADLSAETRKYIRDITEITKEKERIGTELELATKIQADMLPNIFPPFPERTEFDIFASMDPAKEVGGDFYDFFLIDDDHLGLVMADVSGKGVPAALFMMMSKILINNFAMQGNSPARALELTNNVICQNNEEDMFVTVWLGVLEISTGKITAANAGHEYPIIRKANGEYELFKDKHSFVIGSLEGTKYNEYEFKLEKGGSLFLYTDGVPEATDISEELFGTDRLLEAMNKNIGCKPSEMLKSIKSAVDDFVGEADQFDDLTMLEITLF